MRTQLSFDQRVFIQFDNALLTSRICRSLPPPVNEPSSPLIIIFVFVMSSTRMGQEVLLYFLATTFKEQPHIDLRL